MENNSQFTINSPNTVLANSLSEVIDLVQPRMKSKNFKEIVVSFGIQINGEPHMGTLILATTTFLLAKKLKEKHGLPVKVYFEALDNAMYENFMTEHDLYIKMFAQAFSEADLIDMINGKYIPTFNDLSNLTAIEFSWGTYSKLQKTKIYREVLLKSLKQWEKIKWMIDPTFGRLRVRIPCPKCNYTQRHNQDTKLIFSDLEKATIKSLCYQHGEYTSEITVYNDTYVDLQTFWRNVGKEVMHSHEEDTLTVIIKGADWYLGTQPVDWVLSTLGYHGELMPVRIFAPLILADTGAKLSKTSIHNGDGTMKNIPNWFLELEQFKQRYPEYLKTVTWLVEQFFNDPKNFYRSYTITEIERLLDQRFS